MWHENRIVWKKPLKAKLLRQIYRDSFRSTHDGIMHQRLYCVKIYRVWMAVYILNARFGLLVAKCRWVFLRMRFLPPCVKETLVYQIGFVGLPFFSSASWSLSLLSLFLSFSSDFPWFMRECLKGVGFLGMDALSCIQGVGQWNW